MLDGVLFILTAASASLEARDAVGECECVGEGMKGTESKATYVARRRTFSTTIVLCALSPPHTLITEANCMIPAATKNCISRIEAQRGTVGSFMAQKGCGGGQS